MHSLQINYADGSYQVINPSIQFNGKYDELAAAIAAGRKYNTFKVLK